MIFVYTFVYLDIMVNVLFIILNSNDSLNIF